MSIVIFEFFPHTNYLSPKNLFHFSANQSLNYSISSSKQYVSTVVEMAKAHPITGIAPKA